MNKLYIALLPILFSQWLSAQTDDNVTCVVTHEILNQPIVDASGKEVLTNKKVFRHCEKVVTTRGLCKKFYSQETQMKKPTVRGIGLEEACETDTGLGDILATITAINKSTAIFSGVKGYCEKGYTADYSWTEDPLFWTSVTMQAISAMGEDPDTDATSKKLNEKTTAYEASVDNLENSMETMDQHIEDLTQNSIDLAAADKAVSDANFEYEFAVQNNLPQEEIDALFQQQTVAIDNFNTLQNTRFELEANTEAYMNAIEVDAVAAKDALWDMQVAEGANEYSLSKQTGMQKFAGFIGKGYSGCATTGAINMLAATYEFYNPKDNECDPVDEFCDFGEGEQTEDINDPTLIQTLTQEEYDRLIMDDPKLENAMEIIDTTQPGFITVRIKSTGEIIDKDKVKENAQEAMDEALELQYKVKMGMAGLAMAVCTGGEYLGVSSNSGGGVSGDDIAGSVASAVGGMLPYPYNTIASVVQNLATTWTSIDSCSDEEDANAAGTRHVKAYRGIRFGTCHPVVEGDVVERWPITRDVMRRGYEYCCYESPLSKILMVQIKSELGKGWTHCTDVTPNEFSKVSFRACTAQEKDPALNGGYKDGESFRGVENVDYDMKQSYQYKYRCMNLDKLKEYVSTQINIDYGDNHITNFLEDFVPQVEE